MGAEVLDQDGNRHPLKRITLQDIHRQGFSQSDYQETDGRPNEYELRDNLIVLYPAPDNGVNVTLASGLRLFHLRSADTFTSAEVSTGTKEPGFPRPYHMLLVYMAAMPYLMSYKLERAAYYQGEINRLWKDLLKFIGIRIQDNKSVMTNKFEPYF